MGRFSTWSRANLEKVAEEMFDQLVSQNRMIPMVVGLRFTFDGSGQWEAESQAFANDTCLMWRIGVCDDGTFAVSESDPELTDRKECFPNLDAAKEWCDNQESILHAEYRLELSK